MAEALHVSRAYLSHVETDRKVPGLPFLRRASKYFSVPIGVFLMDEKDGDPEEMVEVRKLFLQMLDERLTRNKKKRLKASA